MSASPVRSNSSAPTGSVEPRSFTATLRLFAPVFFPASAKGITAKLLDEDGLVAHRITQWPCDVTLALRPDTILRVVILHSPPASERSRATTLEEELYYSTLCVPMSKVIEGGMALSFCTLWMGVVERNEADTPNLSNREAVERDFAECLSLGQDLTHPKLGISVKIFDGEATEAERASMFSIVDMYENALAGVYSKAESGVTELQSQVQMLERELVQRDAIIDQARSEQVELEQRAQCEVLMARQEKRDEANAVNKLLGDKQRRIEALSAEVHTLKLARKNDQRKITNLQKESEAKRGIYLGGAFLSGVQRAVNHLPYSHNNADVDDQQSTGDGQQPVSDNAAIRRVHELADREKQKTQQLEKELKAVRQQLNEAKARQQSSDKSKADAMPDSPGNAHAVDSDNASQTPANLETRFQAEQILALHKQIASLSKSRSDQSRRVMQLEQQLLEARQRADSLEQEMARVRTAGQKDLDVQRSKTVQTMRTIQDEARSMEEELQRKQQENQHLRDELQRAQSAVQEMQKELGPARMENNKLLTELNAFRSQLEFLMHGENAGANVTAQFGNSTNMKIGLEQARKTRDPEPSEDSDGRGESSRQWSPTSFTPSLLDGHVMVGDDAIQAPAPNRQSQRQPPVSRPSGNSEAPHAPSLAKSCAKAIRFNEVRPKSQTRQPQRSASAGKLSLRSPARTPERKPQSPTSMPLFSTRTGGRATSQPDKNWRAQEEDKVLGAQLHTAAEKVYSPPVSKPPAQAVVEKANPPPISMAGNRIRVSMPDDVALE